MSEADDLKDPMDLPPEQLLEMVQTAAQLQIGKLACKAGDLVLLQVDDIHLLPRLAPMCDMLQRLLPPGVRLCMVAPGVNFSVMTREQLIANDQDARGRPTQE